MSKSEVNAENIHPKEKKECQDVEQELYIAPFEIYDSSENNDDIEDLLYFEDNEITQTSETSFSIGVSASKEISEKENKKSSFIKKAHTVLDVAGFIPGLGAIPDVANGLIYLCEGDFANMGISFLAAIPGFGDAAAGSLKAVKYGAKLKKTVNVRKATVKRFGSDEITEQANYVVKMAKQNKIKKVSLLWTNGTKYNAKSYIKEIKKMAPDLDIKMLETTTKGIQMEKKVNRILVENAIRRGKSKEEVFASLRDGTLWNNVFNVWFKQSRKLEHVKKECEKIQRSVSKKYAREITDDYVIRFKQTGRDLGQASKVEQKILDRADKKIDYTHSLSEGQILDRTTFIRINN